MTPAWLFAALFSYSEVVPKRNMLVIVVVGLACLAAYAAREQSVHGRRVAEVLSLVERSYLDPVEGDVLVDAAIDGVMRGLDEHSAYVRGDARNDLEATLDQRFGGVGLELMMDESTQTPVVASPVLDSPAWRAGIRAGDHLEQIDGAAVYGRPLRDVVAQLRGRAGDRVVVRVTTPPDPTRDTLDPSATPAQRPAPRDLVLTREVIETESVLGDRRRPDGTWEWMLEGTAGVGIIRVASFGERTAAELASAMDVIAKSEQLRGVIIDLRGNPGGLLSAAVDACDVVLDDGVVVQTRGRRARGPDGDEAVEVRRASPGATLAGVPFAVLVDGLTASAAEIVAACLQDTGRATVVGSRTFGKGTVQSLAELSDGRGLLKLTTSEYLRPSGAPIHRRRGHDDVQQWGVSPDPRFEVSPTADTLARLAAWRRSRDAVGPVPAAYVVGGAPHEVDPVLARALEAIPVSVDKTTDLRRQEKAAGDDHDSPGSR